MTYRQFRQYAVEQLKNSCPPEQNDPETLRFEAEMLLRHVTGLSAAQLALAADTALSADEEAFLQRALEEKGAGRPLQYILGEWEFYGQRVFCGEGCLIPRPETEFLAEYAIRQLPSGGCFFDMCTGSGCIPVAILTSRSDVTGVGVDISQEALTYAHKNAAYHGLENRLQLERADMREYEPDRCFDAILSNPPYIRSAEMNRLSREVLREPRIALDGGKDGLDFYRILCRRFAMCLKRGGFFAFEVGYDTADGVAELMEEQGFSVQFYSDYDGIRRIAVGRRSAGGRLTGKDKL